MYLMSDFWLEKRKYYYMTRVTDEGKIIISNNEDKCSARYIIYVYKSSVRRRIVNGCNESYYQL